MNLVYTSGIIIAILIILRVVFLLKTRYPRKAVSTSGKLIIVRHGESDWNKLGLWTGKRDRHLTEFGFKCSEDMGQLIIDIPIHQAYASMQVRTIETLSSMMEVKGQYDVPTEYVRELNERDYGDYTSMNKEEVEKKIGKKAWDSLRREWDYPVPNGETLKMVYERVVPFYQEKVVPILLSGKNVLIVSHGNAIRALVKYIESISDERIKHVEMLFCSVLVFDVDRKGKAVHKEIRRLP